MDLIRLQMPFLFLFAGARRLFGVLRSYVYPLPARLLPAAATAAVVLTSPDVYPGGLEVRFLDMEKGLLTVKVRGDLGVSRSGSEVKSRPTLSLNFTC